jgi:hypothetical protein
MRKVEKVVPKSAFNINDNLFIEDFTTCLVNIELK